MSRELRKIDMSFMLKKSIKSFFWSFIVIISLVSFTIGTGHYQSILYAQKKSKSAAKKNKKGKKTRPKKEKTFQVDFREKDIHDFLKAMSKIIGKNIIADDTIKGKITVISPKAIPASRAFAYLTSVLAVKGYGVVVEDKLLRVITIKDAVAKGRLIHIGKKPLNKEWVRENIVVTAIVGIEHTEPSRLAGILKRVTNKNTEIVDYKETGNIIMTGGALEVDRLLRIINRVDKKIDPDTQPVVGGEIYIIRLKNMEADKVEATLRKITLPASTSSGAKDPKAAGKKIEVVAHKESNSIIFVGGKKQWNVVRDLINKIDVARDQILLEVLIAEVNENKGNSFGIDWKYQDPGAAAFQFNSGNAASALVADDEGNVDTENAIQNAFNSLLGFSLGFLKDGGNNNTTILGLLNANISNDNFLILSAPQILTLNNQEAEINVGEDVPVQTAARTSGGSGADQVTINQFDYRPVGVKLKVTPQINSDQEITLKLDQEIKEVAGSTGDVATLPRFTKRELKTTIKVDNEQTIVIGGLISTKRSESVRKIPLLGDIPLLGYLFRRTATTTNRTNLLVFITPHILTDRDIADKFTEELRKDQIKNFGITK